MPKQKTSGSQTIFWWIVWILATIGSFFVAAVIWTPVIAERFGSVRETRSAVIWVTAVFGTWMVILVPMIILMYQKVDKAYEDARIARENAALRFRSINIDKSKRTLPPALAHQVDALPETMKDGHLVTVALKDGRRIPHVFIRAKKEILGLYDQTAMPFEVSDIVTLEPETPEAVAASQPNRWLRLDGATQT